MDNEKEKESLSSMDSEMEIISWNIIVVQYLFVIYDVYNIHDIYDMYNM